MLMWVCLAVCALTLCVCLRVCTCSWLSVCVFVFRERSSPRDMHQWPNTQSACLPSLNELSRSSEKGSSNLPSISNMMNCYARFAIHSIFSLSFPIKALRFTFRQRWSTLLWRTIVVLEDGVKVRCKNIFCHFLAKLWDFQTNYRYK